MEIVPKHKKILIPVEEYYEDLELWYPKIRLEEEGYEVIVAGPEQRSFSGRHGLSSEASLTFDQVSEKDYAGIVIPGGFAPDWMRRSESLLTTIKAFHASNKLIAFICHAGWVPISAGIVKGKKVTSIPSIKDDLQNAGAIWEDTAVVVDGNFVTSRRPNDLPVFMKAVMLVLSTQKMS